MHSAGPTSSIGFVSLLGAQSQDLIHGRARLLHGRQARKSSDAREDFRPIWVFIGTSEPHHVRDWDHLRVFLAVVRSGSIRGAAKTLETTHATVSRHVRALEAAMKDRLFEKHRSGRRLSPLGRRVLPLAEDIERRAAAIGRIALSANTTPAGPLRMSLPESLYHGVFAEIVDGFMDRHPMIALELITSDQFASLERREADVVVRITRSPPDAAVGRKLAKSPLCAYAAPSYLAARPKLDNWIALQYPPARKPAVPARIVARVNAPLTAARLIRDGRGIGLLPCYLGDTDPGLTRLPGFTPLPDLDIWVLTHKDLKSSPRVRVLMDHIWEQFAPIRARVEGDARVAERGRTPPAA